jgi:hypothetical protein
VNKHFVLLLRVLPILPILGLLGWFVYEQLPVWTAPQPAWVRYPDLMALPNGCEAASALQMYGAARDVTAATTLTQEEATAQIAAVVDAQYPDQAYQTLLDAELVRGAFGDETSAWWSVVQFEGDSLLPRGAAVFISAQTGEPLAVITTMGAGAQGMDGVCGSFTPQPRGLRAQLRPYLPLMVLAGYVGVVGIVAIGLRLRKKNETRRDEGNGETRRTDGT